MREIGQETPALFKHYVKITMREIMETQLQFLYTKSLDYNPLVNVDYTETFKRTANGEAISANTGSSNSNSSNNSSGIGINSDTPQGRINKEDILNGSYASSASTSENSNNIQDTTNVKNNGTSNTNQNEEYIRNFKGNQGITASYQAMIKQFRNNIMAIEKNIIKELEPCFMGLY